MVADRRLHTETTTTMPWTMPWTMFAGVGVAVASSICAAAKP